jgi:hypothetical protein
MTSFALSRIRIFRFSLELDTTEAAVRPGQSRPAPWCFFERRGGISFKEADVKQDAVQFPTSEAEARAPLSMCIYKCKAIVRQRDWLLVTSCTRFIRPGSARRTALVGATPPDIIDMRPVLKFHITGFILNALPHTASALHSGTHQLIPAVRACSRWPVAMTTVHATKFCECRPLLRHL